MVKWVVIWDMPDGIDEAEWERWYFEQHVPLALKMPGLVRYTVGKAVRTVLGPGFYRMAEQYFESVEGLEAAIASPEGVAVAEDAAPYVKNLTLVVVDEDELAVA
jgi:uncharacterized protein (TIGR02118 family)